MRLILVAVLALAFGTGSGAFAAPATGPALGAALASGQVDPAGIDFGALRYAPGGAMGFLSAQATAQTAIAKAHDRTTIGAVREAHICLDERESAALVGFDTALLSADAGEWRAQRSAADEAMEHFAAARTTILAGEPAPYSEFEPAADTMRRSAAASRPELKALFRHAAEDEIWRRALIGSIPKGYAGTLGKAGLAMVNARLIAQGCAVQAANGAWLSATLDTIPWFTIDSYGKNADAAASEIVRHADAQPDLQLKVLNRLGALALAKKTDPRAYAFLWDKVALESGRPQRYGTQLRCIGRLWTPRTPIEDVAQLDIRRSWVGLAPFRTYAANGASVCGGK